jgi:hypothetical protein
LSRRSRLREDVMSEQAPTDVEAIRHRAYEISQGPDAGTEEENWLRAEEELRCPGAEDDAVRRDEEEAQGTQEGKGGRHGGVGGEGNTKQELYERAKKLGVEGRSKMSKSQLAEAIARRQ